jgi:hypothetical protein
MQPRYLPNKNESTFSHYYNEIPEAWKLYKRKEVYLTHSLKSWKSKQPNCRALARAPQLMARAIDHPARQEPECPAQAFVTPGLHKRPESSGGSAPDLIASCQTPPLRAPPPNITTLGTKLVTHNQTPTVLSTWRHILNTTQSSTALAHTGSNQNVPHRLWKLTVHIRAPHLGCHSKILQTGLQHKFISSQFWRLGQSKSELVLSQWVFR